MPRFTCHSGVPIHRDEESQGGVVSNLTPLPPLQTGHLFNTVIRFFGEVEK
jgi:hypothetical protein